MARADGTETIGDEGGNASGVGSIASVNPLEIDASTGSGGGDASDISPRTGKPRRAYTKRGTEAPKPILAERKPEKKTGSPLSVNSIEFSLSGIHALLAVGLAAPELELAPAEAKTIAENIVAVGRHYDLQQSAKATDWGNLVLSLGIVYGGRFVAISSRKGQEARAKRATQPPMGVVTQPVRGAAPGPSPGTMRVEHPPAAGPPAGATPLTRPKTLEDNALLNEMEVFIP